jgi:hypothetical protein
MNERNYFGGDLSGDPSLDPRHFRFERASGLPRDYFQRRRFRPLRIALVLVVLWFGFWITSASVSDEEIIITAPVRVQR